MPELVFQHGKYAERMAVGAERAVQHAGVEVKFLAGGGEAEARRHGRGLGRQDNATGQNCDAGRQRHGC